MVNLILLNILRTIYIVANKHSTNACYQSLEFVVNSLMKQRTIFDQRIKWLKDLYLNLFYDSKRSQGPTPMESILVYIGV